MDNPDLYGWQGSAAEDMMGVQPAVGASHRDYGGTTNLFRSAMSNDRSLSSWDIYNGFESTELAPNR